MGDLGKLIVAKGFKKLPKVKKLPNLVTLVTTIELPSDLHLKISIMLDLGVCVFAILALEWNNKQGLLIELSNCPLTYLFRLESFEPTEAKNFCFWK